MTHSQPLAPPPRPIPARKVPRLVLFLMHATSIDGSMAPSQEWIRADSGKVGVMLDTVESGLQSIGLYDLVAKIADGGMGTVYKGRHRLSGDFVAIKVVPAHLVANPVLRKRFEQEYSAARAIDHPNIVKAIEFGHVAGPNGDMPYLVMEFVDGESVGQKLERIGRFEEGEAVRIISQVAQGLHKAHKYGLIHRDVKPDNILITPDGEAKLVDLGLVKEVEADRNLTRTNRGLGTPHFMAPEQFRNAKKADLRSDIYSMAATLYMMLTGELPYKNCGPLEAWMKKVSNEIAPPRQLAPELSERVDWAIRRSMRGDPGERAANCREFVEDLTGHSTRRLVPDANEATAPIDVWYLVFRDNEGVVNTVKGSLTSIRRSLKEGLLGDASQIRVGRSKVGPFDSLRNHAEFRDLVVDLSAAAKPASQSDALATIHEAVTMLGPVADFAPSNTAGPLLDLGKRRSSAAHLHSQDSSRWVLLIAVAAVAAVIGFLLMPLLTHFR